MAISGTLADLARTCQEAVRTAILALSAGLARCQKMAKKWHFLTPQKNRKSELYAVGTTRRKWRQISLFGGKKIDDFRHFSRVKEKNVLFSG